MPNRSNEKSSERLIRYEITVWRETELDGPIGGRVWHVEVKMPSGELLSDPAAHGRWASETEAVEHAKQLIDAALTESEGRDA